MSNLQPHVDDPLATRMRFNGAGPTFQHVLRTVADDFGRRLAELIEAGATVAVAVLDELDLAVPGNWDELTIPQIEALARRMDESRCNLAWAPRGRVGCGGARRVPGTAPIAVLHAHREGVIDDLAATFETLAENSALGFRVQGVQEALGCSVTVGLLPLKRPQRRAYRRRARTNE